MGRGGRRRGGKREKEEKEKEEKEGEERNEKKRNNSISKTTARILENSFDGYFFLLLSSPIHTY